MDPHKIPFFPKEWCVAPMISADECTLLGITIPCMNAFGPVEYGAYGFEMLSSHMWTFALTLCIGVGNLWSVVASRRRTLYDIEHRKSDIFDENYKWSFWNSGQTMSIITGWYAVITSFFALVRFYWGISKPLLITAALHNLAEWCIVVHISSGSRNRTDLKRGQALALYWISAIICIGMVIPDLFIAFAVEQSFGIILDFLLPILLVTKALFSDDPQVRKFYRLPALAHTIHLFGTIIPLGIAILLMNNPSIFSDLVLEAIINLCVPITHSLYCSWSWTYDGGEKILIDEDTGECVTDRDAYNSLETNPRAWVYDRRLKIYFFKLPEKFKCTNVPFKSVIAFFLGWIPLIILPAFWGQCEYGHCHITDRSVTGTTDVMVKPGYQKAFEDLAARRNLIKNARSAKGNVNFAIIQNLDSQNQYQILETWANADYWKDWTKSPKAKSFYNSTDLSSIVVDFYSKGMYSTIQSSDCRSDSTGALTFDIDNTCSALVQILGETGSCFWIPGCSYQLFQWNAERGTPLRDLHFNDGRIFRGSQYEAYNKITTGIVNGDELSGYFGTITWDQNLDGSCTVGYQFSIPRHGLSGSYILDSFNERIPSIKETFARNGKFQSIIKKNGFLKKIGNNGQGDTLGLPSNNEL